MRGNYSSLQCSASTYQGCQMGNFQTKNPIWLNLDGLAMEDVDIFNLPFGLFCGNSVYFVAIWYTYVRYGYLVIFFPVLVFCTQKNLATLAPMRMQTSGSSRPSVMLHRRFNERFELKFGRTRILGAIKNKRFLMMEIKFISKSCMYLLNYPD
jgi:hypothetical protein